jgi:hypothetical protein
MAEYRKEQGPEREPRRLTELVNVILTIMEAGKVLRVAEREHKVAEGEFEIPINAGTSVVITLHFDDGEIVSVPREYGCYSDKKGLLIFTENEEGALTIYEAEEQPPDVSGSAR